MIIVGGMEIIIEIQKGEDGRPAGTIRSANAAERRSFSGNLQFLALVEDLYLGENSTTPSGLYDDAGVSDHNPRRREQ
jgi:hypothetical protein